MTPKLIFIVIFSSQFSSTSGQVLYITSGILFWFFFSNCTAQGVQSIIQASGLIKSVYIPAEFFPLAEVIAELFNVLLALVVYLLIMHHFGMVYGWHLLWLLPMLFIFSLFTLGVTFALSAFHVFYRDVGILWNTIQPALFYLTPIAYTESLIPAKFAMVIKLNPVYYFIKLFRYPLYTGVSPDLWLLAKCSAVALTTAFIGYAIFYRMKNQFITAI